MSVIESFFAFFVLEMMVKKWETGPKRLIFNHIQVRGVTVGGTRGPIIRYLKVSLVGYTTEMQYDILNYSSIKRYHKSLSARVTHS